MSAASDDRPGTSRHDRERALAAHDGGKIAVQSKLPVRDRDDLALVYTPGVAEACRAIADDPALVRELTIKRNSVAVVRAAGIAVSNLLMAAGVTDLVHRPSASRRRGPDRLRDGEPRPRQVPDPFDPRVAPAVAQAVERVVRTSGRAS